MTDDERSASPRAIRLEMADEDSGDRMDRVLARRVPNASRRRIRDLIANGAVFVNGKRSRIASRPLWPGDRVVVHVAASSADDVERPFEILFEDDAIVVVDKAAGIHVNPTETSARSSLVERVAGGRCLVVHRLDRDTSGVMVLAKNAIAAEELSEAFRSRNVKKRYVAAILGHVEDGVIDAPIGRDPHRPRARAVRDDGKSAQTEVATVARCGDIGVIRAVPQTGRTHQIRVHLSHRGAPILGDRLYGGPSFVRVENSVIELPRIVLHSARLEIPVSGVMRAFEAPLPADLRDLVARGVALDRVFA